MKILITGSAGFIGAALTHTLLQRGDTVIGLDNHNDYYDQNMKEARVQRFIQHENYTHVRIDIANREEMAAVFNLHKPLRVVNLAAQAGVRHSIDNPYAYIDSNVVGFLNVLEECRRSRVEHLVYASSSSVYGANTKLPFAVDQSVGHPLNLYAATKRANELMAHAYSHLYRLPTTGLRFFTVYGPWGRPDMALFQFAKAILENRPINIFNYGHHKRDFTYIDDIVAGLTRVLDRPAVVDDNWDSDFPRPDSSSAPYRIYNIGNSNPIRLMDYVSALEGALGKTAIKNFLPVQPGDMFDTHADVSGLIEEFNYTPKTELVHGINEFSSWYRNFFKV
jgi:UDP-glucuronate 4-epimerase